MVSINVQLVLFITSLLFLAIRLYTGKKRDFIISVSFILLATTYSLIDLQFSILWYFFIAMALSYIGDLLMAKYIKITKHRTVDGAMAFGLAHVFYIIAFFNLNRGFFTFSKHFWIIILVIVMTAILYWVIGYKDDLHIAYKISNFVYTALIVALFGTIVMMIGNDNIKSLPKISALVGVLSFVVSDSVLAYNEFQNTLPRAKEIIAGTYIVAQILLQLTPLLTAL